MHKLVRLLLILCCSFITCTAIAKTVHITNANNIIEVKNGLTFIKDKTDKLTIKEVAAMQNFENVKEDIPNFGVSQSAYWLKLEVLNLTDEGNFLMQISQPGLDEITLYWRNNSNGFDSATAGEYLPFKNRVFFDPNYIFRISLFTNKATDFFLKVKARDNIQVPITIGSSENIFESNKTKDTAVGLFMGVMLVMLFYNAFLYVTVNDRIYLYYIIYLVTVILTQASILGYTFQYLWPGWPQIAQFSSFLFPPMVGIAGILFQRVFLRTWFYYPKSDKGFYLFISGYLLAVAIAIAGYYEISFKLIEIIASLVSVYMLALASLIYKKGFRPAGFFLLAWSVFLIGVTIYVMKDMGILPYNNYTIYTMPIGSAFEVVLLSFALADRINGFKKEKEESQKQVMLALQANEKLITEQNIMLEQKVSERTIELNQTLNNLKSTQSQLVNAEKMASLGLLTAGIAHEINNPINFVSANVKPLKLDIDDVLEVISKYETATSDIIEKGRLTEVESFKKEIDLDFVKSEINMLLSGIENGAKRTAEIVQGLRNFSRLDQSDIKMADINEGIESTLILLRSSIPKTIQVIKNLGNIPIIECYPGKLNQVFMNVLNNAIQAIASNKLRENHSIIISTFEIKNSVCVTVEDTGIGMTHEVKEHVFDPFFTTKDVGEGMGLGMSIVFKIIESHNGKISIDSTPGTGTKITIELPLKLNVS